MAWEIEEIFQRSGGTYGSPKVFFELVRRGWRASVNAVAMHADRGSKYCSWRFKRTCRIDHLPAARGLTTHRLRIPQQRRQRYVRGGACPGRPRSVQGVFVQLRHGGS
ncbi:hypothetical protein [Streptomyces sp. AVP053U2]|uniref:hypothetical protein n=1 Tax=Streptomyces sp. AVP053U2 TaxID=1737066 RepID=UPI0035229696